MSNKNTGKKSLSSDEQIESYSEENASQTTNLEGYSVERRKTSAKHLRYLREKSELKAGDLAAELTKHFASSDESQDKDFISARQLQSMEQQKEYSSDFNKTKNIGAKFIVALADYYHVSTDYILGMTEYSSPDIELAELGKRIGFSDIALKGIEQIIKDGYLPVLNLLLGNQFFYFLLGDIKRTLEYTDKVKELQSKISPSILDNFKLYVNYMSKFGKKDVKQSAEEYLEDKPSLKHFFQIFPVYVQALCGKDYIDYLRHNCVERFSKIYAEITNFDNARLILEYGTDDTHKIALDYAYDIETSGEE